MEHAEITVQDSAAAWRRGEVTLVDVREPHEWQICAIEGALRIPLGELALRAGELDPGDRIVTYCHTGVRSLFAVQILTEAGFTDVRSMRGGIAAWTVEIDPTMPSY